MHIWVDADACPLAVREILYRAAERAELPLTLVANKPLGELYTPDNIRERLQTRDFLEKLRETGVRTGKGLNSVS